MLLPNANKTKFMLFTRNRIVHFDGLYIHSVNGSNIERVTEYKYLCILLDEKFTCRYSCQLSTEKDCFCLGKSTFL